MMSLFALLAAAVVPGAAHAGATAVGALARFHEEHTVFEEYPFTGGDISYGFALEYHEDAAYWQVAVLYAEKPGPSTATNNLDYVLTPQVSLIFKDGPWRGGLGVLASLLEDEVEGSDWTDIYWQFVLGLTFPVMGLHLDARAFYVFESWSDVNEFEFEDIEYGVGISYFF